ncbi:MAG: LacI family DNA-binding transcriptional regulator [Firmicutes bacterium]|nr:LacI family DNA-binding transcriptional regulator [Bacillota bacterium]
MPVTIKDVAKHANVSQSAAAMAIGNYGRISEKTRQRVLEVAKELGYQPNAIARSMIKKRTNVIGIVIPDICNSVFTEIVRGVADVAKQSGYVTTVCNTDEDIKVEEYYLQDMIERRVDGIILASSASTAREVKYRDHTPPIVLVDRHLTGFKHDVVAVDNVSGALEAVNYLVSLGHKRIGIVIAPLSVVTSMERFEGYKRALTNHGIDIDKDLICVSDLKQRGQNVIDMFGRLASPPTALFTANNVVTVGTLLELKAHGIRVPQDVSVIAFDDLQVGPLLNPPLTVVSHPAYMVGSTAAQLLLQRINGTRRNGVDAQTITLKPQLIVRESCSVPSEGALWLNHTT